MDMIKQILVGAGSAVCAAFIIWLFSKYRGGREWFERQSSARQAILAAFSAIILSMVFSAVWTTLSMSSLTTWPAPAPSLGSQVQNSISSCPPGYYVTGVKATDASGGGSGYMKTIQVECRRLNVGGG